MNFNGEHPRTWLAVCVLKEVDFGGTPITFHTMGHETVFYAGLSTTIVMGASGTLFTPVKPS